VIQLGTVRAARTLKDVFEFANERNQEIIWSIQFTTDPLTTAQATVDTSISWEYDVLPG